MLMTDNIALRRQLWQLDYFSEGSIPDALIGVPVSWFLQAAVKYLLSAALSHFH